MPESRDGSNAARCDGPNLPEGDTTHEHEDELQGQWRRVCARLQREVGDVEFRTWLGKMVLDEARGTELTVRLPTRFLRDRVRSQYGDRLTALWREENADVRHVEIRVATRSSATSAFAESPPTVRVAPEPAPAIAAAVVSPVGPAATLRVEVETLAEARSEPMTVLDPRFTFDSFVVGKPNEFAFACARRVAETPAAHGFNPLFLYGGVGLGKTHLMHAIAWELMRCPETERPPISVAYMSAEKFLYRFINALRSGSTIEFKDEHRNVDVLMVDDLQYLVGKEATQEEFFHTFNALVEAGKQIVVSADKSPSDLDGLTERVRTRLSVGMVADLHGPNYELRYSILVAKAARAGVAVPAKVFEFLAQRITTNIRELEGALNRLVAHSSLFHRDITIESTQELLHDILKSHDKRISIEEIQRRVSAHYNIRLNEMSSPRRAREVARPRQIAMYLAKQLTQRSLPEIGRKFGNRDHTTVMHAVSRVGELMGRDAAFAEDVENLRRMLES